MFELHKKWSMARNNKFNAADHWANLLWQWQIMVKQWNVKFKDIPYESFLWCDLKDEYYIIHIQIKATAYERLKQLKAFW